MDTKEVPLQFMLTHKYIMLLMWMLTIIVVTIQWLRCWKLVKTQNLSKDLTYLKKLVNNTQESIYIQLLIRSTY